MERERQKSGSCNGVSSKQALQDRTALLFKIEYRRKGKIVDCAFL